MQQQQKGLREDGMRCCSEFHEPAVRGLCKVLVVVVSLQQCWRQHVSTVIELLNFTSFASRGITPPSMT